jgi:hypothetical protein
VIVLCRSQNRCKFRRRYDEAVENQLNDMEKDIDVFVAM